MLPYVLPFVMRPEQMQEDAGVLAGRRFRRVTLGERRYQTTDLGVRGSNPLGRANSRFRPTQIKALEPSFSSPLTPVGGLEGHSLFRERLLVSEPRRPRGGGSHGGMYAMATRPEMLLA